MIDPSVPPPTTIEDEGRGGIANPLAAGASASQSSPVETLQTLEETLVVSKRQVVAGTVRVSTRTETHEKVAEVAADRDVVDVVRVPVGRIVETAPLVRTEGDTTIIPVLEERFVVVKQLFLKEEVHLIHRVEREIAQVPVTLRSQSAVVERIDGDGNVQAAEVLSTDGSNRARAGAS